MGSYRKAWQRSISDPTAFWGEAAAAISWYRQPSVILDDSTAPFYRWFPDGELNTCYNALDRHVEQGRGAQPALIYDSPVAGVQATFSYRELRDRGGAVRWACLIASGSPKATASSSTCRWCPRR